MEKWWESNQVEFVPALQQFKKESVDAIHHIHRLEEKPHVMISIDVENLCDTLQPPYMIEISQDLQ